MAACRHTADVKSTEIIEQLDCDCGRLGVGMVLVSTSPRPIAVAVYARAVPEPDSRRDMPVSRPTWDLPYS
jgi:hypothetical protein